ncbi:iron chelate uptake ABC transporter family permease subunit [Jeotgalibacillus soli]|uniref:asparaginase n=1 Tax=Jeotgalibacillus soli TaxID=889306 RepID=A0A0C2VDP7_9BACL|nr:iron chelate uptake ABC transporter family permease subunit [Jeotgalibacillus soli]KIL42686.1 iron chelate uptake ABC transporter, FeCT family, permease protein [Jeotgalibacillus soli]
MRLKIKIVLLAMLSLCLIGLYMFINGGGNWDYILPRRGIKIVAIVITGGTIAISTVIFQTITNNRILTPSILGLDSLYMLLQTTVIFLIGSQSATIMNKNVNFLLSVIVMVLFSGILYRLLFKREGQNIYFLLLLGLIFGTFFSSISTFMQVLIDPNEFQIVQDKMFASFNNIHTDLVWLSIVIIGIGILYVWPYLKYLDVLSLGKEQAINLGVDYDHVVKRLFLVIALFISIATSLVGPITFLGLLVANLTYEVMKTFRHSYLLVASVFLSIIALFGGQLLVEHVFTFSTTLSVIINFVGGVYFLYLLLKERK